MSVVIWHNPRCSKSRQTLALLEDKGLDLVVRLYLEDSPTADELRTVIEQLGLESARDLMRRGEDAYKAQNLKVVEDEAALIAAMVQTPKLIERPVVIRGERAALGRPPEAVLALFE